MAKNSHPWRTFKGPSPFPGQTLNGRMPTRRASVRSACALCSVAVKPGQLVAKHFESDSWVHKGCLIRTVYADQQPVAGT